MAVKNNHGRVFFITTDGIYLDELFTDCRVAAANDETYIGGESFGGSFQYDRKNRRAVFVSGGGGYRWYEIKGLDSVAETSYKRTFSARELVEAQEKLLAAQEVRDGKAKALQTPEKRRFLDYYDRLRKKYFPVVFRVREGNGCPGCHMVLPASKMQQAQRNAKLADTPEKMNLVACDYCGRLIFK